MLPRGAPTGRARPRRRRRTWTPSRPAARCRGPTPPRSRAGQQRGGDQLGTLGSGNHFLEVQGGSGLRRTAAGGPRPPGAAHILIHTGSRGLGHQVCTDYVRAMDAGRPGTASACPTASWRARRSARPRARDTSGPWRGGQLRLLQPPGDHPAGREVFRRAFGAGGAACAWSTTSPTTPRRSSSTASRPCVHRKGATRAFGPTHPELPRPTGAWASRC